MGDDVFREDDVVPCGHIFLLWQSVVDCLEAWPECMVFLVECRMLELASECGQVPYVCFQLRQLSRPGGVQLLVDDLAVPYGA